MIRTLSPNGDSPQPTCLVSGSIRHRIAQDKRRVGMAPDTLEARILTPHKFPIPVSPFLYHFRQLRIG